MNFKKVPTDTTIRLSIVSQTPTTMFISKVWTEYEIQDLDWNTHTNSKVPQVVNINLKWFEYKESDSLYILSDSDYNLSKGFAVTNI